MRPFTAILLSFSTAWFVNAQKFAEPHASVDVESKFDVGPHTTVPKWENGFLLSYDIDASTVSVADRSGKFVMRARLSPEGASNVFVSDVTASSNGSIVAALSMVSQVGPGSTLAWLNSAGGITRLVHVASARVVTARFAGDGTLWAMVQPYDGAGHELNEYDMLRHFDANGVLIGSALPRNHFKAGGRYPALGPGALAASKDRIGVFCGVTRSWVELSYSGEILGQWNLPDGGFDETTHVYVTDTDEVYVRYQVIRKSAAEKQQVGVHRFDKMTSTYQRVDTSLATTGLVGVDGDSLVATRSFTHPVLLWVRPQ